MSEPSIIALAAERTLLCLKACDGVPNDDLERVLKNGTFAEIIRLRNEVVQLQAEISRCAP